MGVHLQLSTPVSNQSAPGPSTPALKKRCLQCGKSILLSEMRCHVAKHILKGDLAGVNTCGFCGNDTCSVTLKKTSKKGNQQFFGIDQCDCRYFYKYGKAKKFNKKNNPCTNRIERRVMLNCLSNVWTYNFEHHFNDKHDGQEFPPVMVIGDAKKKFILE